MNSTVKKGNKSTYRKNRKTNNPHVNYSIALLSQKVHINITNVGANLLETLEKAISSSIEGKCIAEGFVRPNSTKVISHSSGNVNGNFVSFEVSYKCDVCYPVNGMKISCVAKNITKAGIRAESEESPNPIVVFIARDHHNKMKYFTKVNPGDNIEVVVIGQRFELNDKYISIIAELVDPTRQNITKKQKIQIEDSYKDT